MKPSELKTICEEASAAITGKIVARFIQFGRTSFAIDFLPHTGTYLLVDYSFQHASTFLIKRRRKEVERASIGLSRFLITLQHAMQDREVLSVEFVETALVIYAGMGEPLDRVHLAIDVAGTLPNVMLFGTAKEVIAAARTESSEKTEHSFVQGREESRPPEISGSLSEQLDNEYLVRTARDRFQEKAAAARKKISSDVAKRKRLLSNLSGDLDRHGDPDEWKRFGDLILANLGQLRRKDDSIFVTDFYDPELRELEIEGGRNMEPTDVANEYFRKYSKARNARRLVQERLIAVEQELEALERHRLELETAIERQDEDALDPFLHIRTQEAKPSSVGKSAGSEPVKGVRRFRSSDGFEIWVGKKAADNDFLTFRLSKSLEYWLHAADYPGSHVIIRNPSKKDVPEKTLVEAAQLAAFYSDGRSQVKANVRYTQRKFVHKPKRSAPGMVSLSSFKTLYVEPKISVENLDARD
jgi:predicted ribosome quality control (RQC) complex YloA/Tae2 family protein